MKAVRIVLTLFLLCMFLSIGMTYSFSQEDIATLRSPLLFDSVKEDKETIVPEDIRKSILSESEMVVNEVFNEIKDKYPIVAMIIYGSVLLGDGKYFNAGTTRGFLKRSDIDVLIIYNGSNIDSDKDRIGLEEKVKKDIDTFLESKKGKKKDKSYEIGGHEINFHRVDRMSIYCDMYNPDTKEFDKDKMWEFLGDEFESKMMVGKLVTVRDDVKKVFDEIMSEVKKRLELKHDLLAAVDKNRRILNTLNKPSDIDIEILAKLFQTIHDMPVVLFRLIRKNISNYDFFITQFRELVGEEAVSYKLLREFIAGDIPQKTYEELIKLVFEEIYGKLKNRVLSGDIAIDRLIGLPERVFSSFFDKEGKELAGTENYMVRSKEKIDKLVEEGHSEESVIILLKLAWGIEAILECEANKKAEEDKVATKQWVVDIMNKLGFHDEESRIKRINSANRFLDEAEVLIKNNARGAQINVNQLALESNL